MPKLPRLRLTTHAQARLVERAIDVDNVKRAIQDPDSRQGSTYGTIRVSKKVGDRTVVVVYSDERFKDRKNEYLIITFYYLDK